jgi:Holliday junction resolvase RusA-like endonuclease
MLASALPLFDELPDPDEPPRPGEIMFTVPGEVVPWARPRFNRQTGAVFTAGPQRTYGSTVKRLAEEAMGGRRPFEDVPIELLVVAQYLRPKSASKRNPPRWKITTPDHDQVIKLVSDSLNRICFRDDGQVASAHVWKTYGSPAGLVVRVRPLP